VQEAQALNQPITEFLSVLDKEFTLSLSDKQLQAFAALSYHDLAPELVTFIVKQLKEKLAAVDQEQLYRVFKDVYLYHIDTLWIKHLDEMEELRDKVGLVGYAQLDPLVIYKSEAFNKFQNLLYRLKYDVTAYIASLDFSAAQAQAQG
jgi:preprotein translocase subunit SecA